MKPLFITSILFTITLSLATSPSLTAQESLEPSVAVELVDVGGDFKDFEALRIDTKDTIEILQLPSGKHVYAKRNGEFVIEEVIAASESQPAQIKRLHIKLPTLASNVIYSDAPLEVLEISQDEIIIAIAAEIFISDRETVLKPLIYKISFADNEAELILELEDLSKSTAKWFGPARQSCSALKLISLQNGNYIFILDPTQYHTSPNAHLFLLDSQLRLLNSTSTQVWPQDIKTQLVEGKEYIWISGQATYNGSDVDRREEPRILAFDENLNQVRDFSPGQNGLRRILSTHHMFGGEEIYNFKSLPNGYVAWMTQPHGGASWQIHILSIQAGHVLSAKVKNPARIIDVNFNVETQSLESVVVKAR